MSTSSSRYSENAEKQRQEEQFRWEEEYIENIHSSLQTDETLRIDVGKYQDLLHRMASLEKFTQIPYLVTKEIFDSFHGNVNDRWLKSIIGNFEGLAGGGNGLVYLSDLLPAEEIWGYPSTQTRRPLFIVKKQHNNTRHSAESIIRGDHSFVHEAFVGLAALNQLRELTPAFIYTYGLLTCGVDERNRELTKANYCVKSDTQERYLFLEYVPNAVTLFHYISNSIRIGDLSRIPEILLQVFSALNAAGKMCGFTHHDLHTANILIQKNSGPDLIEIPLHFDDGVRMLKTDLIVRIIDYGYSRVVIDEIPYWNNSKAVSAKSYHSPFSDFAKIIQMVYYRYAATTHYTESNFQELLQFLIEVYADSCHRSLVDDVQDDFSANYEEKIRHGALDEKIMFYRSGYVLRPGKYRWMTMDNVMSSMLRVHSKFPSFNWNILLPEDYRAEHPSVCGWLRRNDCESERKLYVSLMNKGVPRIMFTEGKELLSRYRQGGDTQLYMDTEAWLDVNRPFANVYLYRLLYQRWKNYPIHLRNVE